MITIIKQRVLTIALALVSFLLARADSGVVSFDLADFEIERKNDTLRIKPQSIQYVFSGDCTQPALPYTSHKIEMNGRCIPNSFTYQIEDMILLYSDVYLTPNHILISDSTGTSTAFTTEYTDSVYPESSIKYHFGTYTRDNKEISYLSISPFIYDACNENLYFISSIRYYYETENLLYASEKSEPQIDYLIVTSNALKDAFTPLKKWKTQKGIKTEIVTIEDIYIKYSNDNTTNQEKIKQCLYDHYLNNGLQWVLLGGDDNIVPTRNCKVRYIYEDKEDGITVCDSADVVSDLYYSSFGGEFSWDKNQNGIYGELEDGMNLYSNVFLSRLPVRNSQQATSYIKKLIKYEQSPPLDGWIENILMMGRETHTSQRDANGRSDGHLKSEQLYEFHIAPFANNLNKKYLYDTGNNLGYEGGMTNANLLNAINNESPHYLSVYTHGGDNTWKTCSGAFYCTSGEIFLNDNKPMVVATTACHTNDFACHTSLSEAMLRSNNGGAIAYWGSSDSGWGYENPNEWGPSLNMCAWFWTYLFSENNQFAHITTDVKEFFLPHANTYSNTYLWLLLSMNAIGDSELPIYTSSPSIINDAKIDIFPTAIYVNTNTEYDITIASLDDNGETFYNTKTDTTSYSFASCRQSVCLTQKNTIPYLIETGKYITENGYASLYLQNVSYPSGKVNYSAEYITIGSEVDETCEEGEVKVKTNAELVLNCDYRTIICNNFKCEKGARLIIR